LEEVPWPSEACRRNWSPPAIPALLGCDRGGSRARAMPLRTHTSRRDAARGVCAGRVRKIKHTFVNTHRFAVYSLQGERLVVVTLKIHPPDPEDADQPSWMNSVPSVGTIGVNAESPLGMSPLNGRPSSFRSWARARKG